VIRKIWRVIQGHDVIEIFYYARVWQQEGTADSTSGEPSYGQSWFSRREEREIEKFIIRQPPMGENDDYDGENSWISDGLPSSSRRRRRGGGRWEVGEWREK